MAEEIDGASTGSSRIKSVARLPLNSRNASARAAGNATTSASAVTVNAIQMLVDRASIIPAVGDARYSQARRL